MADSESQLIETRIVYRHPADTAAESLANVVQLGRQLKTKYEARGGHFRSTGLGFGGTVDRTQRKPHRCLHEAGWEEIDVVRELEQTFSLPAAIENDCKLAALAEAHFGAGQAASTVFYMTIGTGVGGGLVRKGRIQQLSDIGEAEIGHMVVEPDGPKCWCGSRGCIEALCSGPGMTQLASWMSDGQRTATSKELMTGAFSGDEFARRVVERASRYLATAIAAAVNLTAADAFIVGGGVGASDQRFLDLIREHTMPLIVPYFRDRFQIHKSALGEHVVTQGAAILASQLEH